jgi:hypothetical protein
MPDYSKAKIYAIRAPGTDDIYYGSTVCALSQRLSMHRCLYKRYLQGKTNRCTSFSILERDGAYIELVEDYPCQNKEQLARREGEIIRNDPKSINRCVAGRTPKEYKEDNSERVAQKAKEWYARNRERMVELDRLRRGKKLLAKVDGSTVQHQSSQEGDDNQKNRGVRVPDA